MHSVSSEVVKSNSIAELACSAFVWDRERLNVEFEFLNRGGSNQIALRMRTPPNESLRINADCAFGRATNESLAGKVEFMVSWEC